MPDQPTLTLTDRALQRLRGLATGNGLEPAAIMIYESQEKTFDLSGVMEVSPLCETESVTYAGRIKDKTVKQVTNVTALQESITMHKKQFRESPDWIAATIEEIKSHDSQGWGLENAKVTLPEKSASFAVTETCPSCQGRKALTCPQCQGQGTVICTRCQGQGRELCYYCAGRGEDPQHPGQRCYTCQGTRYAPCRFCQANRYLSCPTCHGSRGTPCTICQSSGGITQQVTITCGAETHFKMTSQGLPSALRRGLDRIGIANLGKGHADITASPIARDEENPPKEGAPIPVLSYQVLIPYAEIRMGLGNKKAIIGVVGKRCAINGVPYFLDEPLRQSRDHLHAAAAAGKGSLEQATETRALKEVLALTVAGKGNMQEVRRLYPYGLSPDVITAILSDMHLALKRTTLRTRSITASLCVILCAAFYYSLFIQGLEHQITLGWNPYVEVGADIGILIGGLVISWLLLNFATRFALQRRFPQMKFALQQKIGKIGWTMLGGISLCFIAALALTPLRPLWFAFLHL